ncbi:hypothetical protein EDC01DRAFT_205716 [Geopyxis carbonaria]|nr:hypothetical protein EDC01DRAFT_205716 [Geopyxis carbonaria]
MHLGMRQHLLTSPPQTTCAHRQSSPHGGPGQGRMQHSTVAPQRLRIQHRRTHAPRLPEPGRRDSRELRYRRCVALPPQRAARRKFRCCRTVQYGQCSAAQQPGLQVSCALWLAPTSFASTVLSAPVPTSSTQPPSHHPPAPPPTQQPAASSTPSNTSASWTTAAFLPGRLRCVCCQPKRAPPGGATSSGMHIDAPAMEFDKLHAGTWPDLHGPRTGLAMAMEG